MDEAAALGDDEARDGDGAEAREVVGLTQEDESTQIPSLRFGVDMKTRRATRSQYRKLAAILESEFNSSLFPVFRCLAAWLVWLVSPWLLLCFTQGLCFSPCSLVVFVENKEEYADPSSQSLNQVLDELQLLFRDGQFLFPFVVFFKIFQYCLLKILYWE